MIMLMMIRCCDVLFQCCLHFTISSESNKIVFPGERLVTKAYPCVIQHQEILTKSCSSCDLSDTDTIILEFQCKAHTYLDRQSENETVANVVCICREAPCQQIFHQSSNSRININLNGLFQVLQGLIEYLYPERNTLVCESLMIQPQSYKSNDQRILSILYK